MIVKKFIRRLVARQYFIVITLLLCCYVPAYSQGLSQEDSALLKNLNPAFFKSIDIDPKKGLQLANKSLALAKKIKDPSRIVTAQQFVGYAYEQLEDTKNALLNYNEAVKLARLHNLKKEEAGVMTMLGDLYRNMGDLDKTFETATRGLTLVKEANDTIGIARASYNMGLVLFGLGKFEESTKYYLDALAIFKERKDTAIQAKILSSIGTNYNDEKKYPEALNYMTQAVQLFEQHPGLKKSPLVYSGLAYYYADQNKQDSVIYYYGRSAEIAEAAGDRTEVAYDLCGIGGGYLQQGKLDKAEEYYKKAIKLGKELPVMDVIIASCSDMAELYAKKKDYKNAYLYHTEFVTYRDSAANLEKAKKLEELTVKFEVKELADKNKLLENQNELQRLRLQRKDFLVYAGFGASVLFLLIGLLLIRQNKLRANQQRMELEQKQLLAQINPHFIFNCLNSIQQFVVQNDTMNANRYLADFALLMRQTLDNSKDGVISVRREMEYLENYLSFERMRFEDKFSYSVTAADEVNVDMIEIPSMIVQPFVENAIRHGLFNLGDRVGKLTINFFIQARHLICEVDDNGIGREESNKIKEQRLIKYQSHGMDLTRQRLALVSKMHSNEYTITIIDKKDDDGKPAGTTIVIKFPL